MGEKQILLEKYDMLPADMPHVKKAQSLGMKQMSLRNILKKREQIMSCKNSTVKRVRFANEREVEVQILAWLKNVIPNQEISLPVIAMKASDIGRKMGKENFNPGHSWAYRLLQRNNISLKKKLMQGNEQ